ncbi:MAG: ERAP1-like C-terminal domain-containing protein [Acidobacteriota bacterium]|nr:MAG: ERAP1-like C-terminal domain-containing protein [Acidobacteriota bacterium]
MKILLGIFALFFFAMTANAQAPSIEPGVPLELAKWRAEHYSNVRYKVDVWIDWTEKASDRLEGRLEISVDIRKESSDEDVPIVLDWRKIAGHEQRSTLSYVRLNDREAEFVEVEEHLIFRKGVRQGRNKLVLNFSSPILTSGAAVTRYKDTEDGSEYIYSLFVPSDASTAFPVFDQPDLKARFLLSMDIPKDWVAISNGGIDTSRTRPGIGPSVRSEAEEYRKKLAERRYVGFEETKPISTYVFAFAAGPFEVIQEPLSTRSGSDGPSDRVPIRIFVRKSQAHKLLPPQAADAGEAARAPVGNTDAGEDARGPSARAPVAPVEEVFRLNREAIEYLEDYFDYPFPFPKYYVVLIPEFPFGGMEHAGATFLRETSVIFPTEPTANNYISRASVIFHEAAHQWFGDTVTMKWFDDLWLKEGFATFMAYKTMEKVLPEYDPWKVFYQRTKSAAYQTDVTSGTTPIHQELPNLSAAKSAYGNIVYQKAPSFLKQAEFFWGEEIFREAVRQFLNSHEFGNATWHDLVDEIAYIRVRKESEREFFKKLSDSDKQALIDFTKWHVRSEWAWYWVSKPGTAVYRPSDCLMSDPNPIADLPGFTRSCGAHGGHTVLNDYMLQEPILPEANYNWLQDIQVLRVFENGETRIERIPIGYRAYARLPDLESNSITRRREFLFPLDDESEAKKKDDYSSEPPKLNERKTILIFPNYRDYGYGIFLLDEKSRNYILKNIRDEKDEFFRAQMWGSLWDSVRFAELAPLDYINLAIANIDIEKDETTISSILGRVAYAYTYYLSEKQQDEVTQKLEALLVDKIYGAPTVGQRITYFRALLGVAKGERARAALKELFRKGDGRPETGDGAEESEVRSQETGDRRPETGDRRPETGDGAEESEVRSQETGDRRPETGVDLRSGGATDGSPAKAEGGSSTEKRVLRTEKGPTDSNLNLNSGGNLSTQYSSLSTPFPVRPKDRFDIATRLIVAGDPDGAKFLAELEKTEKDDAALRWAYAAKAGFATKENKAKYWKDFTENKEISESWIEEASGVWNSPSHSELTLPYLDEALAELPALKRNRKIFFVNNWLGSFIGGQKSEEALQIVNRFLEANPKLDADLKRKILENVDGLERAVKIRAKFGT